MFELLVGKAHERFERSLVAEPMVPAQLENLGTDVALDEPEHVRVRASLNLTEQASIVLT